jgi:hypothetical protein
MMSDGVRGVPGVPVGWVLVKIGQPLKDVDHIIGRSGNPRLCDFDSNMLDWAVIRKIEQPARYRPFANAEEFAPHRDRWVRVVKEDNMSGCDLEESTGGFQKIVAYEGYEEDGWLSVRVSGGWITCGEAFECFVFDDGTPFGVRIDE